MKRKWQRVLSWILTLTMLLGTFEGTGVGTIKAQAADPDAVVTFADGNGDNEENVLEVGVSFNKAYANWGIIVHDELGRVSVYEANGGNSEFVDTEIGYEIYLEDLIDDKITTDPAELLDLGGYYTVQVYAYDGASYAGGTMADLYEVAAGCTKSVPVTFRGSSTELETDDLYVVNTAYDPSGIFWANNFQKQRSEGVKQVDIDGNLTAARRFEYATLSNTVGAGYNIAPITFAAKQAGNKDAAIFKDVDWELVGGQLIKNGDKYEFKAINGLSAAATKDAPEGNLYGLKVVRNDDGTVTLSGTPNKVITNPSASLRVENPEAENGLAEDSAVLFKLYARKQGDQGGAEAESKKTGVYNMYVNFTPIRVSMMDQSSALQLKVDRSAEGVDLYKDTEHKEFYNAPGIYQNYYKNYSVYNYNYSITEQIESPDWFGQFVGKEGYEVKDDVKDKTNNTILAQTFTLKNTNSNLALTNVDIQIINDGYYVFDNNQWVLVDETMTTDADCFESPDKDDITTIAENGGTASFTVKPVEGKEAKADADTGGRIPYTAWLVIYADQLPACGLRLAKLSLTVNPSFDFTLKVGDEGAKKVDVQQDVVNGYDYIDLGTYSAANDIEDLELAVNDGSNTVKFIPIDNNEETRLPGWVAGKENTMELTGLENMDPVIKIKGSLQPETYLDGSEDAKDFDEVVTYNQETKVYTYNPIGPVVYKSEANDWSVYLIPLRVKDTDNNEYSFFGKLTVKPANLEVKEVVSKTVQNPVNGKIDDKPLEWFGEADLDVPMTNTKEITIKNTNDYAISLNLVLSHDGTALSSNAAALYGDNTWVTIPAGEKISVLVGDVNDIAAGIYTEMLTITGVNNHIIDPFYVNYKYQAIASEVLTIIAPQDEATGHDPYNGQTLATAREINVGFGETKTWNMVTIGVSDNCSVKYNLAQVGDVIDPDGAADPITVTDDLNFGTAEEPDLVNFVYDIENDVTGLGSWGFSFKEDGSLTTFGPIKAGTFYFCVSANSVSKNGTHYQAAYSYYKVNVKDSDKALTISGIDDTVKDGRAKTLTAPTDAAKATDLENYETNTYGSKKVIADDYNFVIETTESLRETISHNITVKNNTKGIIKDVTVEFANIDGNGVFTVTDSIDLGRLEVGQSAAFPIGVKAPGVYGIEGDNGTDTGYYVQQITVKADAKGVADMVFYVKVHVKKSPYVVPFVPNQDYHDSSMDWSSYDRGYTTELVPYFDASYANGIGGAKVAVGTEIPDGAMTLKAKRWDSTKNTYVDAKDYISYEWYPTTSIDPDPEDSSDPQFTLTSNGKIMGRPTHPGTYYMTIKLTDYVNGQDHSEYGYFDLVIVVPGSINLNVSTQAENIVVDNIVDQGLCIDGGYTVFNGSIKDEVPSARKTFTITNKDKEKTLTGLKVTVSGADAAHFSAVVANDQTSIAPTETASFTVAPFNTTVVGDFKAVVRIEADQIGAINIPVEWSVVAPLQITVPDPDDTTVPVGQPFDYQLKSTGGHKAQDTIWKAMEKDDTADDTLLKAFYNSMDELNIGDFQPIKNHASVIASSGLQEVEPTNGLLTTHGEILTGAGTYPFTASVNRPASEKLDSGVIRYPEQFTTAEITITINPTPYVYIKADEDDLNIGKSEHESVAKYILRNKDGKKFHEIEAFSKKISFTYKTQADDYVNTALLRTFELQNDLMWKDLSNPDMVYPDGVPLEVSANILVGGAVSKDFEIVSIIDEEYNDTLGQYGQSKKAGQKFTIVSGNNVFINVRPAAKLAKGTYNADLVIAGSGIHEVRMPLSITIEEATWKIGFSDGEASLSENVITKKPLKRNDVSDTKPATLTVFAVGNQPIKINKVVELKDDGTPFGAGATGQKLVIDPQFELAVAGNGGATFVPVGNPEDPAAEPEKGGTIVITVKEFNKLQDTSAMVRIYYTSGRNNTDQDYVDVEVKYVVYEEMNSKISYTPSNEGEEKLSLDEGRKVLEGYKPADYAKDIIIHNGEDGDLSKGIYYTAITSDKANMFTINGKAADEIELIKAGEDGKVTIAPIAGLSFGYYTAQITFKADNGAEHVVAVEFLVQANDEFSTVVRRDDTRIASGFNPRFFDTLRGLAGADSDNFTVITDKVDGRDAFLIDLNPNTEDEDASRFDVYVTENATKDIIVRKARYSDYNYKITGSMTAALNASDKPSTDVTQPTTTLYYKDATQDEEFKSIVFTVEETVSYKKVRGGEAVVTWYVPYGSTIESAEGFDASKIAFTSEDGKALEGFVDEDTDQPVTTDERILDDHNLVPVWHDHVYATNLEDPTSKIVSGNQAGVEWVWTEDGKGGYTAKVILTCVSDKCNDPAGSVVSANAAISSELKPATCTQGGYTLYTATYLFPKNGITYMDYYKGNILDNGHGHVWSFDWDNVKWDTTDPNAVSANVVKSCVSVSHNTLVDGDKTFSISADKIEFVGTLPTCTEPGSGYYVATFSDADIPAADIAAGKNVVSKNMPEMAPTGHKWTVSDCTMEGSFEEGATSAVLYLVCENDASHAVSVNVTKDNISLISQNAVSKTFRAETVKDMQSLHADFTFWNHTEHVYSVSWNWLSVTSENAVVRAIFTCTVGGEIETRDAVMTKSENVETYTWTATVTGPDGKEYVDTKTFDRVTGEEITHDHVWSKPVWDWTGTTSKNAAAKAIFTCSVNEAQPHVVEVWADITEVRTETTVTYTAKVTGPDNNEYTDVKVIDLATGKEITHEDHVWSKPTWDWKGTTSANGVAKATFNCTKAGEEHVVVLNATVTEKSRKANKVVYVATVSSPAPENKEYKDSCTVTWDENGEKVEPGKGGEDEVEILDGNYIIVGLSPEYGYTGAAIKPAIRLVDVNRDVVMAQGVDYTVKFKNNKKVGTASVTIKGKGNYAGTNAEASFKIVAPAAFCEIDSADLAAGKIKKVAVSDKSFVYNGAEQYPKSVTVTMKDKSVYTFTTEGDGEYTLEGDSDKTLAITYSNNKNKGTATIAATGADGKTKKASYKITAAPLAATMFEVEGTTWAVKAQEAKINGVFGEDELEIVAGQDFKAKYSAKNAGEKAGSVKITGKGNFKGKLTVNYDVEALEISEENIIVNAPAGKKVKVSVVDNAGNALNKKFFSFTSESSDGEVTVTVTAGPKAGSNVDFGEGVSASATSTSKNLGKVKIKVNSKAFSKYFTGEPVVLEEEDFAKIDTKGLVYGTDFEVASYKNNFKKGTMTVTLKGIGEYSGIKTIKVKIVGKPVDKVVEQ